MGEELAVLAGEFSVRFWGVRGSTPTPGPETLRYGGETTALEIRAGDQLFLVDCGSGGRKLGHEIMAGAQRKIDLLFTHTHLDHICGLPFFQPAYDARFEIRCWAGHFIDHCCLLDVIGRIMSPPIFPVAADTLRAVSFKTYSAGDTLPVGGEVKVETVGLNHPGGACGYKLTYQDKSIAIITDHEHGNPAIDAAVETFVQGVDVMVYDSMFSDEELPNYVGWGHSTWQEAMRLAQRAGIPVPVIFHHDPGRSDDALDEIAAGAMRMVPGARVARQGETIRL